MKTVLFSCLLLFLVPIALIASPQELAFAQVLISPPDLVPPTPPPGLVLPEGTEVHLALAQEVNPRAMNSDDHVELTLLDEIKLGDTVVIPAGSRAIGRLFPGQNLQVEPTWLRAGDTKIPLRGALYVPASTFKSLPLALAGRAVTAADTLLPVSSTFVSAPASPIAEGKLRLPNGTPVSLLLLSSVSSKSAKPGDTISFEVMEPVVIDGFVVIAEKAHALGKIVSSKPAGMAWRSGILHLELESVDLVTQQSQSLQATTNTKGPPTNAVNDWVNAIDQTQGLALFFLPFAPLQHGNQATLPRGLMLTGFTNGQTLLDRTGVEASQPPDLATFHPDANITIYYPKTDFPGSFDVRCGSVRLGRLHPGRKFTFTLPAGVYDLRLNKKDDPLTLHAEDGADYFLRVTTGNTLENFNALPFGLSFVHPIFGELEASAIPLAKPKDAPDISKFKLEDLQVPPDLQ